MLLAPPNMCVGPGQTAIGWCNFLHVVGAACRLSGRYGSVAADSYLSDGSVADCQCWQQVQVVRTPGMGQSCLFLAMTQFHSQMSI